MLSKTLQLTPRYSGIISRSRKLSDGKTVKDPPLPQVKHMNDLPSAKKFLGLVDLEVVRYPQLKFHKFFGERARQLGNMYLFQPLLFTKKFLIVNTPALLKDVANKESILPERGTLALELIKKMRRKSKLKDGVIFSDGPEWKRLRDPLSKRILRPKFISHYIPEFSRIANTVANDIISIGQKDNYNYSAIIDRIRFLGVDSLNYFMFHKHLDDTDKTRLNEYLNAVASLLKNIISEKWNQLRYKYLPSDEYQKMLDNFQIISNFTREIMAEHSTASSGQVHDEVDFVQYLREETDFNEVDILTTFVDLLAAAVDTTTVSTEWLWYNLAKSPRVQDKLYEEVRSVLGDSSVVTVDHFNKMHYVKMCMKESMRVTPTIGSFSRKIKKAGKIRGVEIPEDTHAIVDLYSMQLNEEYWKDAKEFIPERWEDRSEIDPFSYIPFGTGPRMCIGRRIAEAEMQLVTAHLCRRARIHLEQEPDPILQTIIYPKDLKLSFEKLMN